MNRNDEMALLEKFKQLMSISQRIKKSEVAAFLRTTEIKLIDKINCVEKGDPV